MIEAGTFQQGHILRLEARRIRSAASRDRHGDAFWLSCMPPHRHLVVDVTVASARMNPMVPSVSAPLPLHGSLETGAQHTCQA
jgi:hypothetical protein